MRFWIPIVLAACSSSPASAPDADVTTDAAACLAPGTYDRTLQLDGRQRHYRLVVPASATGQRPLVLLFHGAAIDGAIQEQLSHLTDKAQAEGFVLAIPDGTGATPTALTWNAGACCLYAMQNHVDDVGFVGALLDAVELDACIDPDRIYATGFSNGAIMTHRLACELSDRIAAIAPVAGGIMIDPCQPPRAVPVFEIHGLADAAYPYFGGASTCTPNPASFTPILQTVDDWRTRNGCAATASITYAQGDATCRTFDGCPSGGEVTLCTIRNGKHDWPAGSPLGGPCSGTPTQDLSANDAIWDFFAAHSKRTSSSSNAN